MWIVSLNSRDQCHYQYEKKCPIVWPLGPFARPCSNSLNDLEGLMLSLSEGISKAQCHKTCGWLDEEC